MRHLNFHFSVSSMTRGADCMVSLRLLNKTVISKLDCGSEIYARTKTMRLRVLVSNLHAGIHISTVAFRTSPISSLLCDAGILLLDLRRIRLSLRTYCRQHQLLDSLACLAIVGRGGGGRDHYLTLQRTLASLGDWASGAISELELPDFRVSMFCRGECFAEGASLDLSRD